MFAEKSAHINCEPERVVTSVLSCKCIEKVISVYRYVAWLIYRVPYKHPLVEKLSKIDVAKY